MTVSNITIQWEEVNCVQQNGRIESYLISYVLDDQWIHETTSDLIFTITGLYPSTNYTYTVEAVGIGVHDSTPQASSYGATKPPQSMIVFA